MIGYINFFVSGSLHGGFGAGRNTFARVGPISLASQGTISTGLVRGAGLPCCAAIGRFTRGRGLRAIHDASRPRPRWHRYSRLKIQIFVLSAVFAALAGFLYAHLVNFISPGSFDFLVSVRIVTMVVIGGMASIWGSLLGASLLTVLPEFLQAFADSEMIVYGLILMVIMIFLPQGLTRGIMDAYEGARTRKASKSASVNS